MSDSEEQEQVVVEPMPENKVRFTDFPAPLVEKVIRRKYPITVYAETDESR